MKTKSKAYKVVRKPATGWPDKGIVHVDHNTGKVMFNHEIICRVGGDFVKQNIAAGKLKYMGVIR